MGLNPLLHTRLGTKLILQYPNIPDTSRYQCITCNLTHKSIFYHLIVTYKVFLPGIDDICPIKFYEDEIFGIPCIKTIPTNCPLRDQLPESSRTQQIIIDLNGEDRFTLKRLKKNLSNFAFLMQIKQLASLDQKETYLQLKRYTHHNVPILIRFGQS